MRQSIGNSEKSLLINLCLLYSGIEFFVFAARPFDVGTTQPNLTQQNIVELKSFFLFIIAIWKGSQIKMKWANFLLIFEKFSF